MQPDLLHDVVEAIIRDQLVYNWRFYTLICGLSFVAGAAGQFITSYLKRRGETLATKTDMQEILRQLSETTRVAEEVRSSVSQADWAAREWRTIRRLKLEELLSSAYSLDHWLDLQRSKWVHNETVTADDAPLDRVKLLAALYFPELQTEALAVWLAHQNAYMLILEAGGQTMASRNTLDVAAHQEALSKFREGWKPLYESARHAISQLEDRASKLMKEVAGA